MGRWTETEIEYILKHIQLGDDYKSISNVLGRGVESIRAKLNKMGYKSSMFYSYKTEDFKCIECDIIFTDLAIRDRKFCSQSCNAQFNNKLKSDSFCLYCSELIKGEKYCNNKCQGLHKRKSIFDKIESGDVTLYEKNYKKYLIHKYGNKCMECGWCEVNKTTGNIPVQLEHIDGHSENNSLDNLKLLCPNCHSLTSTYGYLNKGNGRKKRYKTQ